MLSLLPSAPSATALERAVFPPPHQFRKVQGEVRNVRLLRETPPLAASMQSVAQAAGLRYELKARNHLLDLFPHVKLGVWFQFEDDSGRRLCQVDALLAYGEEIKVIEIKRAHCLDAWFQLRELYQPVIKKWRPDCRVRVIEFCRSFDPMIQLPEAPILIYNLEAPLSKDYFYVRKFEL